MPYLAEPAAVVAGYPARLLAVALRHLSRQGFFDHLPPAARVDVLATIAAIDAAGTAWQDRQRSRGNTETARAEDPPGSQQITVREGARMLGITERQMRNLAARGLGSKTRHGWVLDRDAVLAEAHHRSQEAA